MFKYQIYLVDKDPVAKHLPHKAGAVLYIDPDTYTCLLLTTSDFVQQAERWADECFARVEAYDFSDFWRLKTNAIVATCTSTGERLFIPGKRG